MSTYKPYKPTFAFDTEEVDVNVIEPTEDVTPTTDVEKPDEDLLERIKMESSLREMSLGDPIGRIRDDLRKKGINPVSTEYVRDATDKAVKAREFFDTTVFDNDTEGLNHLWVQDAYVDLTQPVTNVPNFDKRVDQYISSGLAEEVKDASGRRVGIKMKNNGDISLMIDSAYKNITVPEAMSDVAQSDYFSELTRNVISQLPVNDKGEIEYNGVPYHWAELYEAFYPVVADKAHEALLGSNKDYYNWAFEQSMGMSYEDWYKGYADKRVSEIEQKIIELRDAVAEETAQIAEGEGREVALSSGTLVPASLLGWASKEGARIEASKQFNDVLESINTFRNNDFKSGLNEGFDWVDALTLGIADLGTSYSQLQLLEKAKRGEALSNSESKVLELLQLTQEFEGIKNNLGWERGLASSVGSGLGSTLAMAPGFALGMTGVSKIGTTVKLLSNVAKNASKKAVVKQVGKNLIHNLGTSYLRGAAVAPLMPSTYTTGLKELQEQYTFNPNGTLKFEPKSKALAFMGGYLDTMSEYTSEVFGSTLGEIIGYGARAFGRVTRLNKVVDAVMDPINTGLSKAIDKGLSYIPIEDEAKLAGVRKALRGMIVPNAELDDETKELMRMFGVQDGMVSEATSEVFGDFMSQVMRDMVGAKTDYSDFKDGTYWGTQLLVSALYGGTMNRLASIKEGISDYQQIVDLGAYNKQILDKIESRELRNKVLSVIADGSIEEMAEKLADIEWEKYHPTDKAKVVDYVRNEMMIQTLAGKVEDGGSVDAFVKEAAKLAGVTYQGKGDTIKEVTVDGRQYYIVDGNPEDKSESSMLICVDKETGERKAILSKILPEQPTSRTLDDVMQQIYTERFSVNAEMTRLASMFGAYGDMVTPTAEIARDMMSRMSIIPPAEGDVITLADGRRATVTQDLENGTYVVRLEGQVPLLFSIPFYEIQSTNPLTAEAQKRIIEGKVGSAVNKAADVSAIEVENGDITEETMAQPTQGVTSTETAEVDAQTAETAAQVEEQVANDTLDMTNIPTDAEGNVDYDAIDDPAQFAVLYGREAGSKAEAAKEVEDLKRNTLEAAAKLEEQAKNEITASAKRKKLKEAKKLRERAAFYDKVLPEFEEMEEEYTSVVKNEYSQQVAEPTLRVLDAMAKKLGLKVRFVERVNGGKANAQIRQDGYVDIAFMERVKSIAFLMGHEFTHRMQDLSPEQYAEFKQMVKDFVGEEVWNALVAQTAQAYAKQNQPFTITLIEDEVTADAAGELVESSDAFLKYLEGKKEDKTFLMKVAEFLRDMATMFNTANDRERERQYLGLLDGVNKLIESAASAETTGNGQRGRYSLIREQIIAPTFYSNAEFAVRSIKQEKATPEQWLKMIEKAGGLKAGEDKWLGLSDWLKASDKKTLTKDEVLQYIAENDIQIEEVSYGDVADISREEIYESSEFEALRESLTEYDDEDNPYINRVRYDDLRSESPDFVDGFSLDYWGEKLEINSPAAAATYLGLTKADKEINETRLNYTTQGLSNKREIALVVPTVEPYNQNDNIHFGDAGEGRAVAWIRFGETTDADGKRVLVIDEIQSKRHQDGREKGYISDEVLEAQRQYDYLYKKMYKEGLNEEEHNRYHSLGQFIKENYGIVPSAPFEKNWAELAFKRMLRYAAENGYDYVAWTTGEQQAERYNISAVLSKIEKTSIDRQECYIDMTEKSTGGIITLRVNKTSGEILTESKNLGFIGKNLSDVLGKTLAEEVLTSKKRKFDVDDLRIGGEGMKAFYDQMLPSFVKKYTKKWGAEVKDITMPDLEENNTMHAVNVTDSMRESVMQGQPKFSLAGTEVGFILKNYDDIQDIATAVETVVKRYPKDSVMLANILSDYRQNADEEEFIQGLGTFAKYFGDKQEKARPGNKQTIEETFGGIWIEDTEEFAKFVSAVNTYPKDRNGEGIAFTDNFFYAYYLNTSNDAIPYAEVDLNGKDSQKYVDKIIKYGENRTAREWANWFNENIRNGQYKNNGVNIGNQTTSTARADGRVDSKLPRLGRYYYTPELYSKVKRAGRESTGRGKVAYSLITPEMEDIRYSMQAPSLLGVHNISLDKLRKVIKMGGLANPSVAVIDVDKQTHDDYGEYSLVLPKNMVDARQGKNAGTWAGDAWTPTYPQIIKRIKDEKSYSRFHTDIEALPEAMRNKMRLEFDSFMEGRSADPLAYWYLFEKGSAPELVLVPSRYSDDITNAVSEATKGSFSMYGLTPDERAKCVDAYIAAKFNGDRAAFEQEMQERINRLTETLETKKSDRVKKWAQDTIDTIKEYGFDYDAVADFIRDVGYDAREKGTVNGSATTMAAREQIKANNLEADYEAWLNSLEERYGIEEYIFDGYTNSGNRRYLPHTLENVSKWMKKQGRQGAVATFPSFGVFIATAIPKMTSLESIRKRKALLGKSKEEYDAFREKWGNVYFELGKRLQPDAKGFDDYGYWRLIEAVGKNNPKEFIKKEYGIELSEEDMAMFNDMVNAIRTEYPARYFETKFERPLQLSDFTAAVVPNDIPLDVESRLKDAGVEVIEYEKGDNASRAEAMQKASQMENVRFSLIGEIGAANLDTYGRYGSPMLALELAREFEAQGKSAKDIRLATNWERGKDGKWRYEIMDGVYNHPQDDDITAKEYRLADILDNPDLYKAYPYLKDIKVEYKPKMEARGTYFNGVIQLNASRTPEQINSTLLHEVQHAIQHIEMFATGGNADMFKDNKVINQLMREIEALGEDFRNTSNANIIRKAYLIYQVVKRGINIDSIDSKAFKAYRRLAGEVESRNVQKRMGMTEEQRLNTLLSATEDVARDAQRMLFYEAKGGADDARYSTIHDMTEEDAYQASLLEEAMRMEREATSNGMDIAQEIADRTGWVRLADGTWKYYGAGKLEITDKASAERAAFRWLESKKAIKKARVRRMFYALIRESKKAIAEIEKNQEDEYKKQRRNVDKVEYILQGQPVESLPIEDQVLVDIALGQRIKWSDGEGKHGLKSELGLQSAKSEGMGAVTIAAKDYVEDYVERLMERNNGYEKSLDDNDIRNAVLEVFRGYPSPKAAIDELYARYKPQADLTQAEDALAKLEYERDAALAEVDAEYKEIFEDFDNNPDSYVREHQEAESYNANLDMYVGSLGKARKEIERMERDVKKRKLSDEEKMAAMRAVKAAVAKELRDGLGRFTRKYDIQRMMDAVSDARTPYAMLKAIDKAMESLFEIKWRREYARMQMLTKSKISYGVTAIDASSFLNTFVSNHKITAADARKIMNDYWRGTKANGVSVAKYIDDTTRQAMEFISEMAEYAKARARFSDIEATEIIAFTRKLREKLEDYTKLKDSKLKDDLANDAVRKAVIDAVDILEMYWKAQELQLSLNDDKHLRDISALEIKAKEITAQLREVNQQIKDLVDGKVVVTSSGVKDRDLLRKELQERYNTLLAQREEAYAEMYNAMPDIIKFMQEANRAVETLLRTGKANLAAERTKRKEHEKAIIDEVLADLASPASLHKHHIDHRDKSVFERIATGVGSTVGAPLGSMDYMLRAICRNAPLGEGRTYNRFAYAFQKAYDNIYVALDARKKMLDDKCNILWGEDYHKVHKMAESTKVMTLTYPSAINTKDGKWKPVENTTDIYVTQAMYILAMWNQAEGRVALERQRFTDESINAIRDALNRIDPRWIEFADWVVEEYLPSGRERYNAVHRDIFGTSMAAVPNYFPIKRAKEELQKEEDVAKGDADLLPSTVVGAIKERTSNAVPIDLETSFFEALNENTSVMEAWAEMAGLIQDINTILSNGAVKKTMLDINSDLFSDFKRAAQVATLSYIGKTPDIDKNLGTILNRLWAGSKIAFRLNTAFKQLSSALLFAGYSADPKFQAILLWRYLGGVGKMPVAMMNGIIDGVSYLTGHSFATIDIMTNIEWAKKNMPSFAKRWNEGVAGIEIMARTTSGNTSWKQRAWYVKFDDAVREVTKFGMKPNAFIDAFTTAAGARAVYDYTYEEMRKEGYSEEEAHTLAIINAEMTFNTTQQSSEGLYLSPTQMDRSVAKTALSTFMNAPYAMFRNTMIGMKEILRDAKKELAEIERLEFKKAMDIAKKQVEAQVAAAVARGEYSEEEAKKRRNELFDSAKEKIIPLVKDRAYNKYVKAQTKAVVMVFLNGYAGQVAFNLMGKLPELLFGDDDEEKKKAVYDIVVHSAWEAPLSMMPVGGYVTSAINGYSASVLPAVDELIKEVTTIAKGLREEDISPEVIYAATTMCMRCGLGLSVDTFVNIALGVENMFEAGMSPEAILKVMNAPESQIRKIVGQRKEGETAKEYYERVMRFYSILDTPIYEDYFYTHGEKSGKRRNEETPRGMSEKQMKRLKYEEAYRRNVVLHYGDGKRLAEIEETRKAYNKLKSEGYGNMGESRKKRLKKLTSQINDKEFGLMRRVGSDSTYYQQLLLVDGYKKRYIELYEQFK